MIYHFSKINEAIRRARPRKDALERIINQWEDIDNAQQFSASEVQVQLEIASGEYSAFRQLMETANAKAVTKRIRHAIDAHSNQLQDRYMAWASMARCYLQSLEPVSNVANESIIHVEAARAPSVGTFNGHISEWPAFRDLFIAEVHDRKIDEVHKLIYLQTACIEGAKQALGVWQPTKENYELAWQALNERYNDVYRIKQALCNDIMKIPYQPQETAAGLHKMVDTVGNTMRQLQTLGQSIENWDCLIISVVQYRLPATVIDAWEQRRSARHEPTLNELLAFLTSRARGREYAENPRRTYRERTNQLPQSAGSGQNGPYNKADRSKGGDRHKREERRESNKNDNKRDGQATNGDKAANPFASPRPRNGCFLCGENHAIFYCRKLVAANIKDRKDMLKQKGICIECLKPHEGQCGIPPCSICKTGKHNRFMCPQNSA